PARNVTGSLRLPGDKSISHRYAMLAGIAEGTTRLENYSTGMDCSSTLGCLRGLGVEWHRGVDGVVEICGRGPMLKAPTEVLDCGNSGSTMRMLTGILAGQEFTSELLGDESLSRRPMARIMEPLSSMGARISAAVGDRPPLRISGGHVPAIDYPMPVASAQVKSSILFAGLFAEGKTRVKEPIRTRDHGELALQAFGAEVKIAGRAACVAGRQRLHGINATVPGDISSAAVFLCAAALFPDSQLTTSQGIEIRDARELRVKESDRIAVVAKNLRALGADVEEREDGMRIPGGQSLHGAEVDSQGDHRMAMAFSVAALRAQGETKILNA